MKTYFFAIKDAFFPQTFEGEMQATSKEQAVTKIKEIYSMELDTTPEELCIVSLYEKEEQTI